MRIASASLRAQPLSRRYVEVSNYQQMLPLGASSSYVVSKSSAAFVTLRLTGLGFASKSDNADETSFFTGELSDRLLL